MEGGDGAAEERGCLLCGGLCKHAELVAAEPESLAVGSGGSSELCGQAAEKRISCRVPVRVVVLLEAVQVEDDQQVLLAVLGQREDARELHGQLPAVAEPGQ